MKKVGVLLAVIAVGVGVALTYHIFEGAVHQAIDLIWYDWLDTDNKRLLIIPAAIVLSLVFFGLQHYLDSKSESHQEEGLGEMPSPTMINYLKVLLIGFFSLVAGASLGPEAVLVPACMILGAYMGTVLFKKDKQLIKLMAAAGIMALFTAFFHSPLVGVLSIFLVTKQSGAKIKPLLVVVAVVASVSSWLTLDLVEANTYVNLPSYDWHINVETILLSLVLVVAGWLTINAMSRVHGFLMQLSSGARAQSWWLRALVASLLLASLYLLGGPLVEFTGNRSIVPMFQQAADLGIIGLVWILIIKVAAISWSKSIGYRGGMIFPTIFVASVLVAMVQLYIHDFNLIYGLIAVLVGAFVANKDTHILV